jgi:nucleoside-diphosphate-sugar epimerase
LNQKIILITGGYGCIGSETTKWLVDHSDAKLIVCSRSVSHERGERVFHGVDLSRIDFIQADVSDPGQLRQILAEYEVPHSELHQAIRRSLEVFMDQVDRGWLRVTDID